MPWLRTGDTAAHHPVALAVLEHEEADDRIVNELFGFISRCATLSAGHLTDYVINRGTAVEIAGGISRASKLLEFGIYAGYLVEITLDDAAPDGKTRRGYKIIEDPEFIHLKTKAEVEWERERRNDAARPELVIPVRLRDGDGCRYCGKVVRWGAQNSAIGATYDHRIPGQKAKDENDMFVACRGCNSGRKNSETADIDYPRLPVPERAFFSEGTVNWLRDHDYVKRLELTVPEPNRKALKPGDPTGNGTPGQIIKGNGNSGPSTTGNGTPGQSEQSNGTSGSAVPTPANGSSPSAAPRGNGTSPSTPRVEAPSEKPEQAQDEHCQLIANPANCLTDDTGIPGSGRDGTGRAGKGREGSETQPPPHPDSANNPKNPPNPAVHPQPSRNRKRPRRRR